MIVVKLKHVFTLWVPMEMFLNVIFQNIQSNEAASFFGQTECD